MPVVQVTIEADTLIPWLDAAILRTTDLQPAWRAVYDAFRKGEADRFGRQGPGWAPLATATQADRARLGIGAAGPILDRSGADYRGRKGGQLKRSLTERGRQGAVFTPGPDWVEMGTSDPVAVYHQHGTRRMPARPVIDVTAAQATEWGEIVGGYLFDGVAALAAGTPAGAGAVFTAAAAMSV